VSRYFPENFDVVWCSFPYDEAPGGALRPGKKSRPCLVVGAETSIHGDQYLKVAYGTTKIDRNLKYSLLISPEHGKFIFRDAGLIVPTAFRLDKVAILPFTSDFFPDIPAMNGLPHRSHCRLGHMNEAGRRSLAQVLRSMIDDGVDLDAIMRGNTASQAHQFATPR